MHGNQWAKPYEEDTRLPLDNCCCPCQCSVCTGGGLQGSSMDSSQEPYTWEVEEEGQERKKTRKHGWYKSARARLIHARAGPTCNAHMLFNPRVHIFHTCYS